MTLLATFKHISSKNANYGAAEAYLTFEHDEFTMKPTLDENGRLIPREDYRISSLNCGDEDFAVACMRANLRYEKNQKREDVKSHHYIICYELIQLIIEKNNLHDFDTWIFFKWIFKTFCAVLIVTNTWNIVMAVFDVAQNVVSQSAGVIISDAGIDISSVVGDLKTQLADWSVGALLGLWFQSVFVGLCTQILSICIFLVIYGRMIEVYLVTSIGPIPFATMVNREWDSTGQNYLRSLLALGFQAFLIMICVGIYAVLVEGISTSGDNISAAIWGCMGYTVLLCYTLFKTSSLAKSLFGAH